jgi:hypothetical protein
MKVEELKDLLRYDLSSDLIKSMKQSKGDKTQLVQMLYDLAWTGVEPVSWRAAWTLEHLVTDDKELIRPYLSEISQRLYDAQTQAQKRHFIKVLLLFPLEDIDMGRLMDLAFQWAEHPLESIAVRAHAIEALDRIRKKVPEITPEFILILEMMTKDESKGISGKAKKVLDTIQRGK